MIELAVVLLATGGAAVGLIASCWSKIKDFVWRFTSLLIPEKLGVGKLGNLVLG